MRNTLITELRLNRGVLRAGSTSPSRCLAQSVVVPQENVNLSSWGSLGVLDGSPVFCGRKGEAFSLILCEKIVARDCPALTFSAWAPSL